MSAGLGLSSISFQGDGRRLRGHAIECRINAEDPYRNFQPCPGLITAYHPPGGPGVRVDTHVYAGYTVPPYYDSLLAKVIVHGNDREEALTRMGQALDSFILEGVTTTIPFLARVIRHPDFAAGRVDTRFLEREPQLLRGEVIDGRAFAPSLSPAPAAHAAALLGSLLARTDLAQRLDAGADPFAMRAAE